jgi:ATP-dependent RNA helicase RhlE
MSSFTDFNLLPTIQATLAEKGLVTPTEIQSRALPQLLKGKSVVGVSETGSGKTLAYALPILHQLKELENKGDAIKTERQPRAIVVVPTHTTRLRVRTLLGGTTMEVAKKSIQGSYEVLVATPGRLVKLIDRKLLSLSDVRTLVFDEADQMLDQGFLPDAAIIVRACPEDRQLALFSATVSTPVQKLINNLFSKAEVIRSDGSHRVVATLTTENLTVVDGKRLPLLENLLSKKVAGGTMIFTNTREQCDKLVLELKKMGHESVTYRGQMEKVERRSNLKTFREGKIDLLVSTDLASRGLDLEHVGRVINYHMPQQMENYIHRVGRTARAGRKGLVINFVTERDQEIVQQMEHVKAEPRRRRT